MHAERLPERKARRRLGRPPNDQRGFAATERINFRLTAPERSALERWADESGLSITEVIREALGSAGVFDGIAPETGA